MNLMLVMFSEMGARALWSARDLPAGRAEVDEFFVRTTDVLVLVFCRSVSIVESVRQASAAGVGSGKCHDVDRYLFMLSN